MADISFYHLTTRSLENALPKLLELTLKSGERAVVLTGSEARVEALNEHLWSYEPNSWLPHGSNIDGEEAEQPIYLTTTDENPNNATFLFLIDGAASDQIQTFKRVFELFDGRDKELVEVRAENGSYIKNLDMCFPIGNKVRMESGVKPIN